MMDWIETLKQWENMDLQRFCPGHGRVVDKSYVVGVRKYYEQLVAVLENLKARGVPVREAVSHSELPVGYWSEDLDKPGWFDPAIANLYQSLDTD